MRRYLRVDEELEPEPDASHHSKRRLPEVDVPSSAPRKIEAPQHRQRSPH
jgi:hypothetical protein